MTKWPRGRAAGFVVVALLVAVGVSFLATAGAVFAQAPTVSIESGEIVQGGSGEVLTLSADVTSLALCWATIDVVYDPGVKTPTDCEADPGDNFSYGDCKIDYTPDTVRVAVGIGTAQGVTGDVPLADITWRAVGLAGAKTTLDVQVVEFWDCQTPPVAITPVTDVDGENEITAQPQPPPPASPSPTLTPTATPTPTPTPTVTATATPEVTPTVEVTPTPEVTPTVVVTPPPVVTPTPGITPAPGVTPTPGAIVTPAALPPTGAGGLSDGGSAPWTAAVAAGGLLALLLTAASISRAARRRAR
jgi:hypothetical protein